MPPKRTPPTPLPRPGAANPGFVPSEMQVQREVAQMTLKSTVQQMEALSYLAAENMRKDDMIRQLQGMLSQAGERAQALQVQIDTLTGANETDPEDVPNDAAAAL